MIAATPADGYVASCAAIEHLDLLPRLGEIRAPTLVISAAQDQAAPPEHGERIAAAIPGARFELLDGAAHLANLERPDDITRLIVEHLEG
jgi:3-oxoadipate enol-lactonase